MAFWGAKGIGGYGLEDSLASGRKVCTKDLCVLDSQLGLWSQGDMTVCKTYLHWKSSTTIGEPSAAKTPFSRDEVRFSHFLPWILISFPKYHPTNAGIWVSGIQETPFWQGPQFFYDSWQAFVVHLIHFFQAIRGRSSVIPAGPPDAPFFDDQHIADIIQYDEVSRATITVIGTQDSTCLSYFHLIVLVESETVLALMTRLGRTVYRRLEST